MLNKKYSAPLIALFIVLGIILIPSFIIKNSKKVSQIVQQNEADKNLRAVKPEFRNPCEETSKNYRLFEQQYTKTKYYTCKEVPNGKYANFKRIIGWAEGYNKSDIWVAFATQDETKFIADIITPNIQKEVLNPNITFSYDLIDNRLSASVTINNLFKSVRTQPYLSNYANLFRATDSPNGVVVFNNSENTQYIYSDESNFGYKYVLTFADPEYKGVGLSIESSNIKIESDRVKKLYTKYNRYLDTDQTADNILTKEEVIDLNMEKIGTLYGVEIFKPRDVMHELIKNAYKVKIEQKYLSDSGKQQFEVTYGYRPNYEQYLYRNPVLIIKDPWDNTLLLGEADIK